MKKADLHVHTSFSMDSDADMEQCVKRAIAHDIDILGFCDHIECGEYYATYDNFDFIGQRQTFLRLKEKYANKIKLLLSVEFGEPHLYPKQFEKVQKMPFDYIVGSIHLALDMLHHKRFADMQSAYDLHFEHSLKLARFGGFQILAHLDFIKKFTKIACKNTAVMHPILDAMLKNNLCLEVNTSSYRKGLTQPMPDIDTAKLFMSQGGLICINSDSHTDDTIGDKFTQTCKLLNSQGKMCYFENKIPTIY